MPLLCRVAENMFWMSRYLERAISVIRLVDVTAHLELDAGEADVDAAEFWSPLLDLDGAAPPAHGYVPDNVRYHLAFDTDNPASIVACVRSARAAAREVRDSISSEMWEQLNATNLMLQDPPAGAATHSFFARVRDNLLLIQGLSNSTLAHDEAWHFLSLGSFLERADNVARLLQQHTHLLTPSAVLQRADDTMRWLALLRSAGCAEAYARHYSLRADPVRVLEFLLLNPIFPQTVRYSLSAAWTALSAIAVGSAVLQDVSALPPVRSLGRLRAGLEHATIDEAIESGLPEYLQKLQDGIAEVSEHVTRAYFRYEPRIGRHMAVARAAQIMAAQQQQQHA